jgi:hypothetical protein
MAYNRPINEIPKIADEQVLITRQQARVVLGGVCYMTIARLEADGKLQPVQLSEGVTSKKFYLRDEVMALTKRRTIPPIPTT